MNHKLCFGSRNEPIRFGNVVSAFRSIITILTFRQYSSVSLANLKYNSAESASSESIRNFLRECCKRVWQTKAIRHLGTTSTHFRQINSMILNTIHPFYILVSPPFLISPFFNLCDTIQASRFLDFLCMKKRYSIESNQANWPFQAQPIHAQALDIG